MTTPNELETLRRIMTHHRKDCVNKHEDCFEVQLQDALAWHHEEIGKLLFKLPKECRQKHIAPLMLKGIEKLEENK